MIPRRFRPWTIAAAVIAALTCLATEPVFLTTDAEARAGRGGSFGSRGSRTFNRPPATNTAPKAATPIQRSTIQPSTATTGVAAGRTATAAGAGGLMSRPGLLGGLAAGFIGAGLLGMLFGHGLAGGLGGLASILGLLLQIGLIGMVAWLAWSWWQRRNQPALAGAGNTGSYNFERTGQGAPQGSASPSGGSQSAASMMPAFGGGADGEVELEAADYDAFEQLLSEVQEAVSNEDLEALRQRSTPEMFGYFSEDIAENKGHGVVNKVANVKLESGDLSEAWREGNAEYATVAMRFSLTDYVVDRNSGQVVDGDANTTVEATELWTFCRTSGGQWMLSAIQQA